MIVQRNSGLLEYVCEHGIGHPILESVKQLEKRGLNGFETHGCSIVCMKSGKCHPKTVKEAEQLTLKRKNEQKT